MNDSPLTPLLTASRFDDASLAEACRPPYRGGCEAAPSQPAGEVFLRHLEAGGLGLWLRTDTAQSCDVATIFTEAVCRRLLDRGDAVCGFGLAVHEAVANAIIHGNLEIASPGGDAESFDAYCRLLDERLAAPQWAGRHVELSAARVGDMVEVAVRNEGRGYRPQPTADAVRFHGMDIMSKAAEVTISEEGRLAVLRFAIEPDGGDR